MRWPRSLQARLLVLVLGAVAAVWLGTAVLVWRDAQHELDELLDAHLAQAAALLVVQQAGELDDDHESAEAPILHRYAARVAFQVWHEGRLLLRSSNAPAQPLSAVDQGFAEREIEGRRWRVFATRGAERDVRVHVGEVVGSRSAILRAVLHGMLTPMLVGLPVLALLVWLAVRQGSLPLRRLERLLARRDPQALEPVHVEGAPSEMAPMLAALNTLFDRIRRLIESERRFTADAAHELRTPIAAIRAQAQVAMGEADDARRRHALQATLAGCDRASRLVEQLLNLARLEAASATAAAAPVDLGAVAQAVVAEQAGEALDKAQEIELEAQPDCLVPGDPALLGMLVRNLVDNAIRYSPQGARVRVRVARRGGEVVLSVEDSGPGLTPEQIDRLGERFFRVLGSDASGSGLGWSIVRRIAQALDLRVQVHRSADLGGLAVEVAGRSTAAPASQPLCTPAR